MSNEPTTLGGCKYFYPDNSVQVINDFHLWWDDNYLIKKIEK